MTRHRATALLDRADARFGMGEIDGACADASEALSLVAHVEHTGHLDRVESLSARVLGSGSAAALALSQEVQLTRLDHRLPLKRNAE